MAEMRVYLAGPIFGRTDAECNDWREEARRRLYGCEVVNPMGRDYRGCEGDLSAEIVEGDKADILTCGCVLVNCAAPSWGTAMEIHFAHGAVIPVVGFAPRPWSPWLVYHTTQMHEHIITACSAIFGRTWA